MDSLDLKPDLLHTTPLGVERINRNLSLIEEDIVQWCREVVAVRLLDGSNIERRGKNWYVDCGKFIMTINAHSHTIITAHMK
ncbi:DUF3781 domain-containing protein [Leucobacter coleopterorum]|uniref:DUF3781 domain-containing protein n=1 Tax=Leucobacter coleopterorum TaxID=2714933 RepID=A0ABX6K2B3_9MICO|nr:DUF3781 domain-containing protein [Leucobacter coleopterorum]QIM19175.1 DUF3781 domain-containing protein [Leucobacter coleopterorum]